MSAVVRHLLLAAAAAMALAAAGCGGGGGGGDGGGTGGGGGGGGGGGTVTPVNTATRVYVVNSGSDSVSIVDVATQAVVKTVPVGSAPSAMAVDNVANRAYVANAGGNSVSVLDTLTEQVVATVAVGSRPGGVAVNPRTHRVYVANSAGNSVSVIDGAGASVLATVPVGSGPAGLSVNPATSRLFVANAAGGSVSVLDTATNALVGSVAVGLLPGSVAADPTTTEVYVTNRGSNRVSVINSVSLSVSDTVVVDLFPAAVAVNPIDNRAYVVNAQGNTVMRLGVDHRVQATAGARPGPEAVAIDAQANRVWVANKADNSVNLVDTVGFGTAASFKATVGVGTAPVALAVVVPNQAAGLPYPDLPNLGLRWAQAPGAGSHILGSVAFGNGRFVALAGGRSTVETTDGQTLTPRTPVGMVDANMVAAGLSNALNLRFLNGRFVVADNQGRVAMSVDGLSWTASSVPGLSVNGALTAVTYGKGLYVAVGHMATIATSPDGQTWTVRNRNPNTVAGNVYLFDVAFLNGQFMAVGQNGLLMTSADGLSWSTGTPKVGNAITTPKPHFLGDLRSVAYGNGMYIIGGTNLSANSEMGSGYYSFHPSLITSTDGVNWTERADVAEGESNGLQVPAVLSFDQLLFANGAWVALCSQKSGAAVAGALFTSYDGIHWAERTPPNLTYGFYGVAFGNGRLVMVGGSGLGALVLASTS